MARRPIIWSAVLAAALVACGGARSLPTGQARDDVAGRLEHLTGLDRRVAEITYRLAVATTDVCPRTRANAGWALHAANQYSGAMRPVAVRRFGLSGDLPGVLSVIEGGPTSVAGVRPGDLIVAVDGRDLDGGAAAAAPSYEGFAANLERLELALEDGRALLKVQRQGELMTLAVSPILACDVTFQVNPTDDANAGTDGRRIFITSALAAFAATEDDLAVVLSHEVAHIVLGHRAPGRSPARMPWSITAQERAADRTGVFLMARAGFDHRQAPDFWRRFGAAHWQARYAQWGHPSAGSRAQAVEPVVAEVSDLMARDLPLGVGAHR